MSSWVRVQEEKEASRANTSILERIEDRRRKVEAEITHLAEYAASEDDFDSLQERIKAIVGKENVGEDGEGIELNLEQLTEDKLFKLEELITDLYDESGLRGFGENERLVKFLLPSELLQQLDAGGETMYTEQLKGILKGQDMSKQDEDTKKRFVVQYIDLRDVPGALHEYHNQYIFDGPIDAMNKVWLKRYAMDGSWRLESQRHRTSQSLMPLLSNILIEDDWVPSAIDDDDDDDDTGPGPGPGPGTGTGAGAGAGAGVAELGVASSDLQEDRIAAGFSYRDFRYENRDRGGDGNVSSTTENDGGDNGTKVSGAATVDSVEMDDLVEMAELVEIAEEAFAEGPRDEVERMVRNMSPSLALTWRDNEKLSQMLTEEHVAPAVILFAHDGQVYEGGPTSLEPGNTRSAVYKDRNTGICIVRDESALHLREGPTALFAASCVGKKIDLKLFESLQEAQRAEEQMRRNMLSVDMVSRDDKKSRVTFQQVTGDNVPAVVFEKLRTPDSKDRQFVIKDWEHVVQWLNTETCGDMYTEGCLRVIEVLQRPEVRSAPKAFDEADRALKNARTKLKRREDFETRRQKKIVEKTARKHGDAVVKLRQKIMSFENVSQYFEYVLKQAKDAVRAARKKEAAEQQQQAGARAAVERLQLTKSRRAAAAMKREARQMHGESIDKLEVRGKYSTDNEYLPTYYARVGLQSVADMRTVQDWIQKADGALCSDAQALGRIVAESITLGPATNADAVRVAGNRDAATTTVVCDSTVADIGTIHGIQMRQDRVRVEEEVTARQILAEEDVGGEEDMDVEAQAVDTIGPSRYQRSRMGYSAAQSRPRRSVDDEYAFDSDSADGGTGADAGAGAGAGAGVSAAQSLRQDGAPLKQEPGVSSGTVRKRQRLDATSTRDDADDAATYVLGPSKYVTVDDVERSYGSSSSDVLSCPYMLFNADEEFSMVKECMNFVMNLQSLRRAEEDEQMASIEAVDDLVTDELALGTGSDGRDTAASAFERRLLSPAASSVSMSIMETPKKRRQGRPSKLQLKQRGDVENMRDQMKIMKDEGGTCDREFATPSSDVNKFWTVYKMLLLRDWSTSFGTIVSANARATALLTSMIRNSALIPRPLRQNVVQVAVSTVNAFKFMVATAGNSGQVQDVTDGITSGIDGYRARYGRPYVCGYTIREMNAIIPVPDRGTLYTVILSNQTLSSAMRPEAVELSTLKRFVNKLELGEGRRVLSEIRKRMQAKSAVLVDTSVDLDAMDTDTASELAAYMMYKDRNAILSMYRAQRNLQACYSKCWMERRSSNPLSAARLNDSATTLRIADSRVVKVYGQVEMNHDQPGTAAEDRAVVRFRRNAIKYAQNVLSLLRPACDIDLESGVVVITGTMQLSTEHLPDHLPDLEYRGGDAVIPSQTVKLREWTERNADRFRFGDAFPAFAICVPPQYGYKAPPPPPPFITARVIPVNIPKGGKMRSKGGSAKIRNIKQELGDTVGITEEQDSMWTYSQLTLTQSQARRAAGDFDEGLKTTVRFGWTKSGGDEDSGKTEHKPKPDKGGAVTAMVMLERSADERKADFDTMTNYVLPSLFDYDSIRAGLRVMDSTRRTRHASADATFDTGTRVEVQEKSRWRLGTVDGVDRKGTAAARYAVRLDDGTILRSVGVEDMRRPSGIVAYDFWRGHNPELNAIVKGIAYDDVLGKSNSEVSAQEAMNAYYATLALHEDADVAFDRSAPGPEALSGTLVTESATSRLRRRSFVGRFWVRYPAACVQLACMQDVDVAMEIEMNARMNLDDAVSYATARQSNGRLLGHEFSVAMASPTAIAIPVDELYDAVVHWKENEWSRNDLWYMRNLVIQAVVRGVLSEEDAVRISARSGSATDARFVRELISKAKNRAGLGNPTMLGGQQCTKPVTVASALGVVRKIHGIRKYMSRVARALFKLSQSDPQRFRSLDLEDDMFTDGAQDASLKKVVELTLGKPALVLYDFALQHAPRIRRRTAVQDTGAGMGAGAGAGTTTTTNGMDEEEGVIGGGGDEDDVDDVEDDDDRIARLLQQPTPAMKKLLLTFAKECMNAAVKTALVAWASGPKGSGPISCNSQPERKQMNAFVDQHANGEAGLRKQCIVKAYVSLYAMRACCAQYEQLTVNKHSNYEDEENTCVLLAASAICGGSGVPDEAFSMAVLCAVSGGDPADYSYWARDTRPSLELWDSAPVVITAANSAMWAARSPMRRYQLVLHFNVYVHPLISVAKAMNPDWTLQQKYDHVKAIIHPSYLEALDIREDSVSQLTLHKLAQWLLPVTLNMNDVYWNFLVNNSLSVLMYDVSARSGVSLVVASAQSHKNRSIYLKHLNSIAAARTGTPIVKGPGVMSMDDTLNAASALVEASGGAEAVRIAIAKLDAEGYKYERGVSIRRGARRGAGPQDVCIAKGFGLSPSMIVVNVTVNKTASTSAGLETGDGDGDGDGDASDVRDTSVWPGDVMAAIAAFVQAFASTPLAAKGNATAEVCCGGNLDAMRRLQERRAAYARYVAVWLRMMDVIQMAGMYTPWQVYAAMAYAESEMLSMKQEEGSAWESQLVQPVEMTNPALASLPEFYVKPSSLLESGRKKRAMEWVDHNARAYEDMCVQAKPTGDVSAEPGSQMSLAAGAIHSYADQSRVSFQQLYARVASSLQQSVAAPPVFTYQIGQVTSCDQVKAQLQRARKAVEIALLREPQRSKVIQELKQNAAAVPSAAASMLSTESSTFIHQMESANDSMNKLLDPSGRRRAQRWNGTPDVVEYFKTASEPLPGHTVLQYKEPTQVLLGVYEKQYDSHEPNASFAITLVFTWRRREGEGQWYLKAVEYEDFDMYEDYHSYIQLEQNKLREEQRSGRPSGVRLTKRAKLTVPQAEELRKRKDFLEQKYVTEASRTKESVVREVEQAFEEYKSRVDPDVERGLSSKETAQALSEFVYAQLVSRGVLDSVMTPMRREGRKVALRTGKGKTAQAVRVALFNDDVTQLPMTKSASLYTMESPVDASASQPASLNAIVNYPARMQWLINMARQGERYALLSNNQVPLVLPPDGDVQVHARDRQLSRRTCFQSRVLSPYTDGYDTLRTASHDMMAWAEEVWKSLLALPKAVLLAAFAHMKTLQEQGKLQVPLDQEVYDQNMLSLLNLSGSSFLDCKTGDEVYRGLDAIVQQIVALPPLLYNAVAGQLYRSDSLAAWRQNFTVDTGAGSSRGLLVPYVPRSVETPKVKNNDFDGYAVLMFATYYAAESLSNLYGISSTPWHKAHVEADIGHDTVLSEEYANDDSVLMNWAQKVAVEDFKLDKPSVRIVRDAAAGLGESGPVVARKVVVSGYVPINSIAGRGVITVEFPGSKAYKRQLLEFELKVKSEELSPDRMLWQSKLQDRNSVLGTLPTFTLPTWTVDQTVDVQQRMQSVVGAFATHGVSLANINGSDVLRNASRFTMDWMAVNSGIIAVQHSGHLTRQDEATGGEQEGTFMTLVWRMSFTPAGNPTGVGVGKRMQYLNDSYSLVADVNMDWFSYAVHTDDGKEGQSGTEADARRKASYWKRVKDGADARRARRAEEDRLRVMEEIRKLHKRNLLLLSGVHYDVTETVSEQDERRIRDLLGKDRLYEILVDMYAGGGQQELLEDGQTFAALYPEVYREMRKQQVSATKPVGDAAGQQELEVMQLRMNQTQQDMRNQAAGRRQAGPVDVAALHASHAPMSASRTQHATESDAMRRVEESRNMIMSHRRKEAMARFARELREREQVDSDKLEDIEMVMAEAFNVADILQQTREGSVGQASMGEGEGEGEGEEEGGQQQLQQGDAPTGRSFGVGTDETSRMYRSAYSAASRRLFSAYPRTSAFAGASRMTERGEGARGDGEKSTRPLYAPPLAVNAWHGRNVSLPIAIRRFSNKIQSQRRVVPRTRYPMSTNEECDCE